LLALRLITGLVCGLLPGTLSATTTVYTNEADFVAAFGILPMSLNEFSNADYVGWLAHPLRSNTNGISYYIVSQPPLYLVGYSGAVSTYHATDGILVSFTSGNVTGIGGYLYVADTNRSPVSGTLTVALDDGTTTNVTSTAGAPPFIGFLSDGPIYNFFSITNNSGTGYPALSHLYVVDGIPTPSIALTPTNTLSISWYAAPTGFVLQASTDAQGTGWTNLNLTPQLTNNHFQVAVPLSGAAGFFRLIKQ
jgi:hypothetical protein